jgi:hypothetical protein
MAGFDLAKECPKREVNLANCPCENMECERRGICCECVANHRAKGNRPACMK